MLSYKYSSSFVDKRYCFCTAVRTLNFAALVLRLPTPITFSTRRADHRAVELGYSDFDWMQQDPDLDGLKAEPGYTALVSQLKPQS